MDLQPSKWIKLNPIGLILIQLSLIIFGLDCGKAVTDYIIMKSFKNIVKRSPEAKGNNSVYNNQGLPSQRSKNNSQNLLKKYNQTNNEIQKMTSRNKYRIVTEPMDDNMQQITKSYSKLVRSKQREVKFDSQHTSIKLRQKTFSNQKRIDIETTSCLFCRGYQNELKVINEQIKHMMSEKDRWKKGELLLQDFEKQMDRRIEGNDSNQLWATVEIVKQNILDLMSDIEALTDIEFPKILSYNIFNTLAQHSPLDEELEIKALLTQLREQSEGRTTAWDYDLDQHNEYIRVVMRNLKSNLAHYIRQNIQLKTKISLLKKEGSQYDADIRFTVLQILKGVAK